MRPGPVRLVSPWWKSVRQGGGPARGSGIPTFRPRSPAVGKTAKMCDCLMLHLKVIFPTEPPVRAGDWFSRGLVFRPGKPTFPRGIPRLLPGECWVPRLFPPLPDKHSPGEFLVFYQVKVGWRGCGPPATARTNRMYRGFGRFSSLADWLSPFARCFLAFLKNTCLLPGKC